MFVLEKKCVDDSYYDCVLLSQLYILQREDRPNIG